MPIDNENIKAKIVGLNAKDRELQQKLNEIRHTSHELEAILEREVDEPDPRDPKKTRKVKKIRDDEVTKKPFTPARRQEVYDACIAEAERLLA